MFNRKHRLRTLMLILSVGGILLTSALLLGALTIFQKGNIEDSFLENNIAYARKLADTTDHYLSLARRELSYSASILTQLNDKDSLQHETNRLCFQPGFFNSVIVVTADAVIAATSPESLSLMGVKLNSEASRQAIFYKKPLVSEPFLSAAGNYVIFLSQPLFSTDGQYIGYIGGTVYLKKQSMLSEIIGQHFYDNQTDVSVVTDNGLVLFNHNPALIGTKIKSSPELLVRLAQSGNGHFVDTVNRKADLIGFASLNQAGWYVLISGASENVASVLLRSASNAGWFILAIIALTVAIVTFFSARLTVPLERLAELTMSRNSESALKQLAHLNAGYHEAEYLREAVSHHLQFMTHRMNMLSDEAMKDSLTGLYNRKGLSSQISNYIDTDNHSIIVIDIDCFKSINDRFGHSMGDIVLKMLSEKLRISCREFDVICRHGGEEFVIFLPQASLDDASFIAESIRCSVSQEIFPVIGNVTISAGVAALNDYGNDFEKTFRHADLALYEAKNTGRNTVVISVSEGVFRYRN